MLSPSGQVKVFLAAESVDMRKSFDTLAALVQDVLRRDPLSGDLFVFRGRPCYHDRKNNQTAPSLLHWEDRRN